MRRTKIVCTLGPASDGPGILEGLVRAGMDVARLNFSHGTHGEHLKRMEGVRSASGALGRTVGILQDLGGPKIRTGGLRGREVELRAGNIFTITTLEMEGSEEMVQVPLPEIVEAVKPGDPILLGDGA
ncbi:MAG: pyruvate kinase, partial [Candidatus Hydrothermarchaeota archaeon]